MNSEIFNFFYLFFMMIMMAILVLILVGTGAVLLHFLTNWPPLHFPS